MRRATIVFLVSVSFLALHYPAMAQEPSPTASTESPSGSEPHSNDWKINNALSAGPDFATDHATVMDSPKPGEQHGTILRAGSNGWPCMPGRPGKRA